MTDINELSANELQQLIANANIALGEKQKGKRKEVIAKIKELAASINAVVEIHEAGSKSSPVSVKYRNPNDHSQTWTGRGLAPKWLKAMLDAGHSKEEFLIVN